MAICDYCNQEMKEADGCHLRPVETIDGALNPIAYGNERRYALRPPQPGDLQHGVAIGDPPRCHDCGALPSHYHHVVGCDWEECPRCYEQLLSCECRPLLDEEELLN
jgi:hypothetical protein